MKGTGPWHQVVQDIRQGKNVELYVTIIGSVIVVALGLFNAVDIEIVLTAILAILSLVAFGLLTDRTTTRQIENSLEEVIKRMGRPGLNDVFFSWQDRVPELRSCLAQSREVWIVTRSGLNFWREFSNELLEVANRGGVVHILLLDPDGMAFETYKKLDRPTAAFHDPTLLKPNLFHLLGAMHTAASHIERGSFDINVIDYVAPSALVLTDPQDDGGTIQVGLGTILDARVRPSFVISATDSPHWFTWFRKEFETLWAQSRPAFAVLEEQRRPVI